MAAENIEIRIGDVVRGFRTGLYGLSRAIDAAGVSQVAFFEGLAAGNTFYFLCLFYGAAVHYARHRKQPVDFSDSDVAEWIEEAGMERMQEVSDAIIKTVKQKEPEEKNQPAPETGPILKAG